jgi:hypothetical protein
LRPFRTIWAFGGRENGLNEPQTVDRLDARDLLVRGFGIVFLLVIAFVAVSAMS